MKTTMRIYYRLRALDSEATAAWAIAVGLTLVAWRGVMLVAGVIN